MNKSPHSVDHELGGALPASMDKDLDVLRSEENRITLAQANVVQTSLKGPVLMEPVYGCFAEQSFLTCFNLLARDRAGNEEEFRLSVLGYRFQNMFR